MGTGLGKLVCLLRARFRYLQGIWGPYAPDSRRTEDRNLDTFKDIWGPTVSSFAKKNKIDLDTFKDIWGLPYSWYFPKRHTKFRYLQGYMGTS